MSLWVDSLDAHKATSEVEQKAWHDQVSIPDSSNGGSSSRNVARALTSFCIAFEGPFESIEFNVSHPHMSLP
jgi:hypothetical protein